MDRLTDWAGCPGPLRWQRSRFEENRKKLFILILRPRVGIFSDSDNLPPRPQFFFTASLMVTLQILRPLYTFNIIAFNILMQWQYTEVCFIYWALFSIYWTSTSTGSVYCEGHITIIVNNIERVQWAFWAHVTFQYIVHAFRILQYVVYVCVMRQSIGHHQLYRPYNEHHNTERVQRVLQNYWDILKSISWVVEKF